MANEKKSRSKGGGGHRVTIAEQNRRVEQLEICLAQGWHKGEIKRHFKTLWSISGFSVERYLSRARENLCKALGETREDHRARSLHLYRSVLSDSKASIRDKLSAQKNIDRLLGLPQPILVAQTTPEGKSLLEAARELTEEQAVALASLRFNLGGDNGG